MTPRRKGLLGLLLLLLALAPRGLAAQEPADGFRIETITVEGGRRAATQGIVIAESQLTAGQVWSERELREAVYRIRRLPFIVRADFALRRGTARGLYALVITVEETRPFFFSADAEAYSSGQRSALEALGYGDSTTYFKTTGTAGARLFTGAHSVLFALLDSNAGLEAGYTRYGLFGRGGAATVSVARHLFCCQIEAVPLALDPGFVTWMTRNGISASGSVIVPLVGNQSLRASASWSRRDDPSSSRVLDTSLDDTQSFDAHATWTSRQGEIKWFYDTADDPLFPTQGVTLSGGVELAELTAPVRRPGTSILGDDVLENRSRQLALAATGRRSWSFAPGQTLTFGGRLAVGRSRIDHLLTTDSVLEQPVDLDTLEASVEARYSSSLRGWEKIRELGDLRFELRARYGYESTSPSLGGAVRQLAAGPSIAFRNGWGVFRLGFTYLNFQRSGS